VFIILLFREAILKEERENYCTFNRNDRNELLFKVLSAICFGGRGAFVNGKIIYHVDITKMFYKNLVWQFY